MISFIPLFSLAKDLKIRNCHLNLFFNLRRPLLVLLDLLEVWYFLEYQCNCSCKWLVIGPKFQSQPVDLEEWHILPVMSYWSSSSVEEICDSHLFSGWSRFSFLTFFTRAACFNWFREKIEWSRRWDWSRTYCKNNYEPGEVWKFHRRSMSSWEWMNLFESYLEMRWKFYAVESLKWRRKRMRFDHWTIQCLLCTFANVCHWMRERMSAKTSWSKKERNVIESLAWRINLSKEQGNPNRRCSPRYQYSDHVCCPSEGLCQAPESWGDE